MSLPNIVLLLVGLCALVCGEYRSLNGSNNNLNHPLWGSIRQPFLRRNNQFFYEDGISVPRGGDPLTGNVTLPNERHISNVIFNLPGSPDPIATSDWSWVVGQFFAEETTHTTFAEFENITMPAGDQYFAAHGGVLPFQRANIVSGSGVTSPRVQFNSATPWLDAHIIYGENAALSAWIRKGTGGLLKFVDTSDGEFPPRIGDAQSQPLPAGVTFPNNAHNVNTNLLFMFGDPRANQNPSNMCYAVLWWREHNRQARELAAANSTLDDETLFQEARRRVIALMQHFYETEYIPTLLGTPNLDPYTGYDETADPSMNVMFAAAALRYGHSQVSNFTQRLNEDGTHLVTAAGGDIRLKDNFFDPTMLDSGCSPLYRGLAAHQHNSGEVTIIDDLRNFLFSTRPAPGNDLLATNMRRAREEGLPNYAQTRASYGLAVHTSWMNVTDEWFAELESLYGTSDPSTCDPWLCGLLEPGINDGELGELFHFIVKDQFERMRNGDRFWYMNNQFSASELATIQATKLSDIIMRNSQVQCIHCSVFDTLGSVCCKNGATSTSAGASTFVSTTASASSASSLVVSIALAFVAMLVVLF